MTTLLHSCRLSQSLCSHCISQTRLKVKLSATGLWIMVSLSENARANAPLEGRCMGHPKTIWYTVSSSVERLLDAHGARPHVLKLNRLTSVWTQLSLIHALLGRKIPSDMVLTSRIKYFNYNLGVQWCRIRGYRCSGVSTQNGAHGKI